MDTATDPSTLAGWLAQIAEYAPDLFADDGTPSADALSIAQSCEAFRNAGASDNWASILTTGSLIAANAMTRDREHGTVNAQRAAVDSLIRDYDRDPSPVARTVDPFIGQQHKVQRGRNKKGATAIVRSYGAATVQGSCAAPVDDDVRATMAEHLLSYVRSMPCGTNALNVTQVTDAVYGALLPAHVIGLRRDGSERTAVLIGTEVAAHSEVFDPYHPACFEPIAEHNMVTVEPLPRAGATYTATDPDDMTHGPHHRPRLVWQAHAAGSHTDDTRRAATFRDRPLPRVKARKSEASRLEPKRILCIMRGECRTIDLSTTRRPLISPDVREGMAWFGHKLMARGERQGRQGARDRARAVRRVIVSRTLPSLTISAESSARVLLEDMTIGESHKFRVNDTFILQVSRRAGKFNCQVWQNAPIGKTGNVVWQGGLQVRSAGTLARRIAAAVI